MNPTKYLPLHFVKDKFVVSSTLMLYNLSMTLHPCTSFIKAGSVANAVAKVAVVQPGL